MWILQLISRLNYSHLILNFVLICFEKFKHTHFKTHHSILQLIRYLHQTNIKTRNLLSSELRPSSLATWSILKIVPILNLGKESDSWTWSKIEIQTDVYNLWCRFAEDIKFTISNTVSFWYSILETLAFHLIFCYREKTWQSHLSEPYLPNII